MPTYRKLRFLRFPEGLIAVYTIPQEGTLGIFLDQVLRYPKHHDERAPLSMKHGTIECSFMMHCYPTNRGSLQRRLCQLGCDCLFVPPREYQQSSDNHRLLSPAISSYNDHLQHTTTSCMYLLMWKIRSHLFSDMAPRNHVVEWCL